MGKQAFSEKEHENLSHQQVVLVSIVHLFLLYNVCDFIICYLMQHAFLHKIGIKK